MRHKKNCRERVKIRERNGREDGGSGKGREGRDGEIVGSEMTIRQKQCLHKGWFTPAVSFQSKVSPGIQMVCVTHPDY